MYAIIIMMTVTIFEIIFCISAKVLSCILIINLRNFHKKNWNKEDEEFKRKEKRQRMAEKYGFVIMDERKEMIVDDEKRKKKKKKAKKQTKNKNSKQKKRKEKQRQKN